jgi:diaminopimelate epimerase
VGETASSGTGAVAVAAACVGEGETVVRFPGGALTVRIEDGRATLIGPAEPLDPSYAVRDSGLAGQLNSRRRAPSGCLWTN